MRACRGRIRLAMVAAIVFAVAATLVPGVGSAVPKGEGPVGEWVMTPEAAVRTAAGDCLGEYGPDGVCLEWCLSTDGGPLNPTGIFDCFPGS